MPTVRELESRLIAEPSLWRESLPLLPERGILFVSEDEHGHIDCHWVAQTNNYVLAQIDKQLPHARLLDKLKDYLPDQQVLLMVQTQKDTAGGVVVSLIHHPAKKAQV